MAPDHRDPRAGQALRPGAGGGRRRPGGRGRRDLWAGGAERRRQDDDHAHPGHAAGADRRRGAGLRHRRDGGAGRGAPTHRLHARLLRRLRRPAQLGVPGLLRALLRRAGREAGDHDRRAARDRGADREAQRLRRVTVARHAPATVPGPHAGPRSGAADPGRARIRPRSARPGRGARDPAHAARHGQDDPGQQPHPAGAGRAVHLGRDHRSRAAAALRPHRRDRALAARERHAAHRPDVGRGRGNRLAGNRSSGRRRPAE